VDVDINIYTICHLCGRPSRHPPGWGAEANCSCRADHDDDGNHADDTARSIEREVTGK
jgi:hypothetical protein